jgi:hypothetical protein
LFVKSILALKDGRTVMKSNFENLCVKLPESLLKAFRIIVANKGEEPNSVLAQLIKEYVEEHRDNSFARISGVIDVYVQSLLNLLIDWPPVQETEAGQFIELTLEEIHRKLVVTDDQARMVAYRIWQELRKSSGNGDKTRKNDAGSEKRL